MLVRTEAELHHHLPLLDLQLRSTWSSWGGASWTSWTDDLLRGPIDIPPDIPPQVLYLVAGAAGSAATGLVAWLALMHAQTAKAPASPELEAPEPDRVFTRRQLFALTCPTMAYSCTATTLAFMLLPDEARVFPYEASWTLGLLYAVGALAELPGPMLGHVSDCLRTPYGRRRPLILLATTVVVCGTSVQWLGSISKSLPVYAAALLVHMLAWALLYTAQQGLVLDVLPKDQLSFASTCQAIFVAVGACIAFGAAIALPRPLHYHYQYLVTSVLTVVTASFPMMVHEEPSTGHNVAESSTSLFGLFKRYYLLDFEKHYDFSLVMVCKAIMYGVGVAKGYLVYFIRDTWNVTDTRALHLKVASIAISAEMCAAFTAGLLLFAREPLGPNRAAAVGAGVIACAWCVMIPLGFWDDGIHFTELFALVYGVGHGLVLVGDQALTYHNIPEKAHGSRSFGMQSVAAFVGMSLFSFLCSLVLDLFGRVWHHTLPGPRAGPIPTDGYRLEGYVALDVFVTAANLYLAYVYTRIRTVEKEPEESGSAVAA